MITTPRIRSRKSTPRGRGTVVCEETASERRIQVKDSFDFGLFREFGACFLGRPAKATIVDLRFLKDLCTAGLGMMLVLQAQNRGQPVSVLVNDPQIAELLSLANFEMKFQIVGPSSDSLEVKKMKFR